MKRKCQVKREEVEENKHTQIMSYILRGVCSTCGSEYIYIYIVMISMYALLHTGIWSDTDLHF